MVRFKAPFLTVSLLFFKLFSYSQIITLDGTENSNQIPFGLETVHLSEHIYLGSEISTQFTGSSLPIRTIQFKMNATSFPVSYRAVEIYLKTTTQTGFNATTPFNRTGYNLVYSGPLNWQSNGWGGVNLPIPFVFNHGAGNNLQVLISRIGSADNPASAFSCYHKTLGNGLYTSRSYNISHPEPNSTFSTWDFSELNPSLLFGFLPPTDEEFLNLQIHCMIEMFHNGSSTMVPYLSNRGFLPPSNAVHFATVELCSATNANQVVYRFTSILTSDGNIVGLIPKNLEGSAYFIRVLIPGALPVYSALPVTMTSSVSYDFASTASNTFGNNVTLLAPNTYGMYYGDFNHDYGIDLNDIWFWLLMRYLYEKYGPPKPPIVPWPLGSDIPGDATVDVFDLPMLDPNIGNYIIPGKTEKKP